MNHKTFVCYGFFLSFLSFFPVPFKKKKKKKFVFLQNKNTGLWVWIDFFLSFFHSLCKKVSNYQLKYERVIVSGSGNLIIEQKTKRDHRVSLKTKKKENITCFQLACHKEF